MPFDHNDHYHRLLLRQVPPDCGVALDVGCGSGRLARRLAARGITVDAIDSCGAVLEEARALSPAGRGNPRYTRADVVDLPLPQGHYDLITCVASVHHVPFATVAALRDALAPGGALVILGCYRERTVVDAAWALVAAPLNALARLAVAVRERAVGPAPARATRSRPKPPVARPEMTLREVREEAAVLLPGCGTRRLLFWRYLLVFRKGDSSA